MTGSLVISGVLLFLSSPVHLAPHNSESVFWAASPPIYFWVVEQLHLTSVKHFRSTVIALKWFSLFFSTWIPVFMSTFDRTKNIFISSLKVVSLVEIYPVGFSAMWQQSKWMNEWMWLWLHGVFLKKSWLCVIAILVKCIWEPTNTPDIFYNRWQPLRFHNDWWTVDAMTWMAKNEFSQIIILLGSLSP